MANKQSQFPDVDLDKTDQLPILAGTTSDHDVEDDAVRLDHDPTAVLPGVASLAAGASDFVRPSSVDLPSLAESVRSVEERITRQNAEFEALTRAYERSRETEAAAVARANALAVDLGSARTALEAEQRRLQDMDKTLAERSAAVEAARARVEDALRESERHQGESRTLRESLAARETALTQVLHSLGERDAQLALLQSEHAKIVPVLEASSKSTVQLDAELQNSRTRADALALELKASRDAEAALAARLKRAESEVDGARSETAVSKTQAVSYLELLQTREWRRGFDQTLFSELDAQVGAAHLGSSALESERERLAARVAALEAQSAAQLAAADAEQARISVELAARDRTIAEARERGGSDAKRVAQLLEAAELRQAEHATQIAALRGEQAAQIERLQAEAETHDQEMTVLMAHLQEARRPIQSIEADIKRLTDELAAKSAAYGQLDEECRNLRGTLERTRGQLEEREFLIRRLERSESNNANVLGRIQTSIERLGSVPTTGTATGVAAEWSAELIRIDGEAPVTHVLSRRTRIGRASGCELQIESGSVSRHHALIVVGPREAIIEDLNSTNGVIVNGRKVTRQPLADGDAVTIGEIQFRYFVRPGAHSPEPKPAEPPG
ncbi:MAG: FHA domain-containing protein [Steroidobacteraceae bacterium]